VPWLSFPCWQGPQWRNTRSSALPPPPKAGIARTTSREIPIAGRMIISPGAVGEPGVGGMIAGSARLVRANPLTPPLERLTAAVCWRARAGQGAQIAQRQRAAIGPPFVVCRGGTRMDEFLCANPRPRIQGFVPFASGLSDRKLMPRCAVLRNHHNYLCPIPEPQSEPAFAVRILRLAWQQPDGGNV
jgi:hypothetical protein